MKTTTDETAQEFMPPFPEQEDQDTETISPDRSMPQNQKWLVTWPDL